MIWYQNLMRDSNHFLNKAYEFYGELVYNFKKIVGRNDFSDQFRKIIILTKESGTT